MSCRKSLFAILNQSQKCYSDKSSCKDFGKSFSFRSKLKTYCTIKVDGCLITSNSEQKCDYIIVECNSGIFHFIELKGNAIGTASAQIFNTISWVITQFNSVGRVFNKNQIQIHIVCNLSTKANQKKDEIIEDFIKQYSEIGRAHV